MDTTDSPIESDLWYRLVENDGFQVSESKEEYIAHPESAYPGAAILSLASGEFSAESLKPCQHLTQRLLRQVIGNRPLQSRKLWQHSRQPDINTKT